VQGKNNDWSIDCNQQNVVNHKISDLIGARTPDPYLLSKYFSTFTNTKQDPTIPAASKTVHTYVRDQLPVKLW